MGNALFIVWRESAEALLVVGIVYAWLKRQPDARGEAVLRSVHIHHMTAKRDTKYCHLLL